MRVAAKMAIVLTWLAALLTSPLATSPAAAEERPAQARRRAKLQEKVDAVWWNTADTYRHLGLSDEQRLQMDAHLITYLEWRRGQCKAKRIRTELAEALAAGSWDRARLLADELITRAEQRTRQQTDLRLNVIGLLEPWQRQTLTDDYPTLLTRSWLQTTSPRPAAERPDPQRRQTRARPRRSAG